jgi:hypothetical protein
MHVIAQIGQWLNVLFAYGRTQEKPLCRRQQSGTKKSGSTASVRKLPKAKSRR